MKHELDTYPVPGATVLVGSTFIPSATDQMLLFTGLPWGQVPITHVLAWIPAAAWPRRLPRPGRRRTGWRAERGVNALFVQGRAGTLVLPWAPDVCAAVDRTVRYVHLALAADVTATDATNPLLRIPLVTPTPSRPPFDWAACSTAPSA